MSHGDVKIVETFQSAYETWPPIVKQMWDLYFLPEIRRRVHNGALKEPFQLYALQYLISLDGSITIRINEEFRGYAKVDQYRTFATGEAIFIDDIENITEYDLPISLLDCGHFTMIQTRSGWSVIFNFRMGRSKSIEMYESAEQYLQISEIACDKGFFGPSIDTLFSASELIAKAALISHNPSVSISKTHGTISRSINEWSRLGNIDSAFVGLFNRLGSERPNARYGARADQVPPPTKDDFDLIRAMIERGRAVVVPRVGLCGKKELTK